MQIDNIMPSTPRMTNPSPTAATVASSSKPVSFASILEQEQAVKPEPEQTVNATAEDAPTTEEGDSTEETAEAPAETGKASTLVATLLGAQVVAAANTVTPQTQAVITDGGESAPVDPSATPVTSAAAQVLLDEAAALTTPAGTEAKTSEFALTPEPATTVTAPAATQVEAAATASLTKVAPEAIATTEPKTTVTAAQPAPVEQAAPAAVSTKPVDPAAATVVQAATTAQAATAAQAESAQAATAAQATTTAQAATTAQAVTAAQAATTDQAMTAAQAATVAPVAQEQEAATNPQQGSAKPLEPVTETLLSETNAQVTSTSANPAGKPEERKAVAANTGKETGAAVKGAQPVEGAATATAVTPAPQTTESSFRDALAAQAAQPETQSVKADKAVEPSESTPAQSRHTAATPTLGLGQTESTKLVEGAQSAQPSANTPAAAQDPGAVALKSIRFMTLQGEKNLTVKLHPESLGELVIAITTKDGGLDVQLRASQAGTREILERQLGNLRDTLSREGIVVNRMTLTADLSGQQFQQANNRQAGAESNLSRPLPMPTGSAYRDALPAAISAARTARHLGNLDLYA